MNEISTFTSEQFGSVRTLSINGEPWFVATDVCKALEVKNPSDALSRLDADEKMTLDSTEGHSGQRGGAQTMNAVNEPGLYSLVLGSRKPEAKLFKRWITHEVIPTIRKHGAYATPDTIEQIMQDPDFGIRLLGELKAERDKRKEVEAQRDAMKPKALFADAVTASKTSILVGELAKLLKQNGVDMGQTRMFDWLRTNGYLIRREGSDRNMPTQKSMELGLFEIKETCITHADGHTSVNKTPKVTGKGQQYFVNLFLNRERNKHE